MEPFGGLFLNVAAGVTYFYSRKPGFGGHVDVSIAPLCFASSCVWDAPGGNKTHFPVIRYHTERMTPVFQAQRASMTIIPARKEQTPTTMFMLIFILLCFELVPNQVSVVFPNLLPVHL